MKIAIIGTGISGLTTAHLLYPEHEIVVFEANDYIGGHTHTVNVQCGSETLAVDTGFIVFNHRTYPNFVKLIHQLKVPYQPAEMSFSVSDSAAGLEYKVKTLNSLFAQRRNLVNPRFYRLIYDILRFNREAVKILETEDHYTTLGDYLTDHQYSDSFRDQFIIPMGSAIWSSGYGDMLNFPMRYFVQFFFNHGLMSVNDQPQWYVIKGGSREYVEKLVRPFRSQIRLNSPVQSIKRLDQHVEVTTFEQQTQTFDQVILATHGDQALRLLSDASPLEQEVLAPFQFSQNDVVLHQDAKLMPKRGRAWASWNYLLNDSRPEQATLSYSMNILQSLKTDLPLIVTVNQTDHIDPAKILRSFRYTHPIFTRESVASQERIHEINGQRRTWFCGAWLRYGFHEDGVFSALKVCQHFGKTL